MVYIMILLLFLIYSKTYEKIGNEKEYYKIGFCALMHVGFHLMVIVQNQFYNPKLTFIQKFCEYGQGIFLILFSLAVFEYTVIAIDSKESVKRWQEIRYGLLIFFTIMYFCFHQYFYQERTAVIFSIVFFIGSLMILIKNRNKLDKIVFYPLMVLVFLVVGACILQIIVMKFPFTSGCVTVLTVAIFFLLENPAEKIKIRAYMDWDTGVKNKYCFEEDLERMERKWKLGRCESMGIVVCDLNGLKSVNDRYGHTTGDKYIRYSAKILQEAMVSSYGFYRIGGDEFAAVYMNVSEETIQEELKKIGEICERENLRKDLSISIAIGLSMAKERESLRGVLERADCEMYRKKKVMKGYV